MSMNQPDVPPHLLSRGAKASRPDKIRLKINQFVYAGAVGSRGLHKSRWSSIRTNPR